MKKGVKGFSYAILIAGLVSMGACNKNEETIYQPYSVPATYNFDNVDYSEATASVNMWSGLTAYLGKGTTRQLNQDTANYLWNNTNSAFTAEIVVNLPNTFTALNAKTTLSVAGKTTDPSIIKAFIDSTVKVSKSNTVTATKGVAGIVTSTGSSATKRLVNYTGAEFNQLVAKGLMGAFVMKQVFTYLDKTTSDDNNTVVAGKGTAMQHDWDMAFGYISLPKMYDSSISYSGTVIDRPLAIGGYFRERGRFIKAGGAVYGAFLKGRAAIAAKDYAGRDQAIASIKEYTEKTLAAAAFEYSGIGFSSSDPATQFHGLSEGYGFILALKYRPANSKLTEANYQTLLSIFQTDFYVLIGDATFAKLKQAQSILTTAYGQLQP